MTASIKVFADGILADGIPQTAANLGISRTRLYNEIKAGRITALKTGCKTLIPRASQEQWLASLPIAPTFGVRS